MAKIIKIYRGEAIDPELPIMKRQENLIERKTEVHAIWKPFYREYGIHYMCCSNCGTTGFIEQSVCGSCSAIMDNAKPERRKENKCKKKKES